MVNKDKIKQYQREYRQINKEQQKECRKKYRQKNREHIKEYQKEWYQNNKERQKKKQKEWCQNNRGYIKKYQYKRNYNLSLEEVDQILVVQDYKCVLCGKSLMEIKWCVDHNYETNKVRGILCSKCNIGLNYFQYFYSNPELLRKAIIYIEIK